MDEQATFEPKAVLAPRRAGWYRFAAVVPALALAATAWIGISGQRPGTDTAADADAARASAAAALVSPADMQPSLEPAIPNQALGMDVHRLDEVQTRGLDPDTVVAVAGWYVATAITDCPPLAAFYRDGSLPEVRGDIAAVDSWAFCDRSGVLYASRPTLDGRMPTDDLDNNQPAVLGLPAVAATLTTGVVVPRQLETIGVAATPVVVLAHFVNTGAPCHVPDNGCQRELVVDYLAWAPGP